MGGGPTKDVSTVDTTKNTIEDATKSSTLQGLQSGYSSGTTAGGQFGQQDVSIPDWLKQFIGSSTGVAGNALSTASGLAGGWQIPPEALKTLQDTAGGNYLYGGPQQQAFIDAAVRGASPGIFSQFGAAGGGGGGLQKAALDQAAVDAYAKLYQGERTNQIGAAGALPGLTQMPFNMQTQLAQLAGGLPGQFSPFLGQATSGGQFGSTSGLSGGTSSTTGTDTTHGVTSSTGKETTTKPIYQDPWWKTALGVGALGASFIPGIGPFLGAGMNMAGGLLGPTIPQQSIGGGTVGSTLTDMSLPWLGQR